ncbi:sensor histidine kinase [Sphingobium cloacae]|uniref:histidine kinase n=1 Tax=Sphingobium cloacae TaxID=120107 RepID=A0A1E1EZS7_9SPHN|nr:HAMP domain-containing sensor histidine kinase [Sphingobium cloacae]BAV63776.1 signal transduction histidine kinase [Sphingobium cloacae]
MRFNDVMQTVLSAESRSGPGAVTLWRQCVDLLAQHDRAERPMSGEDRAALLDRLTNLRTQLSEAQRIATVVELGSRLSSPALVEFFAHDRPSIAAAAIARARLSDDGWASLLSRLTPTARGVLRGRRDIGPETRRALEAFGPADLVLTTERDDAFPAEAMLLTPDMALGKASPDEDAHPAEGKSQIRNLVDRIQRFTRTKRHSAPPEEPRQSPETTIRSFAFETDAHGAIIWVDQKPRAALIGLSLNEAALDGGSGPDGHVAGAFARRSGFRHGRYQIVGGALAGEWRMSATPFFDPRSGRFQGYRGQARRPYIHEVAIPSDAASASVAGFPADSLRQLVHELRTPLNAILGFAEIIEQELFGAAGPHYRDMAGKIAVDARHLLAAFDELDLAAKAHQGDGPITPHAVDPALLITQVVARFSDQTREAGSRVDIRMSPGLPAVRIDPVQAERMVQHLLRTLVSVTPPGDNLTGSCWFQPDGGAGRVMLVFNRPSSLRGMEEKELLDPGYTAEGDWADGPLLGLGFSLRLIRSLAAGCGAALEIESERILLSVPALLQTEGQAEQG